MNRTLPYGRPITTQFDVRVVVWYIDGCLSYTELKVEGVDEDG
jgi:hypothetical protein